MKKAAFSEFLKRLANHKVGESMDIVANYVTPIKLTFLCFALLLGSCNKQDQKNNQVILKVDDYNNLTLAVVKIDGCEYLYGPWGNATVLTHKGNCKNHKKDFTQSIE